MKTKCNYNVDENVEKNIKTPLFTEELLQAENPHEIIQGTLQFQIPEKQPASIPGQENGIQWQLVFHGTIDGWPDLKQELPFTVYPATQTTPKHRAVFQLLVPGAEAAFTPASARGWRESGFPFPATR